jgi:hypothetical protein
MATPAMSSASASAGGAGKSNRGKDQIQWSDEVWQALDQAVTDEVTRTRIAAKFLPLVYVEKKRTTIESDVVIVPAAGATDQALSVDETETNRIQEYFTTFRLSVAQVEAEEHMEMQAGSSMATSAGTSTGAGAPQAPGPNGQTSMVSRPHRAGTAISLALRCANVLAQAEDLILLNGQNAVANAQLFTSARVQALAGTTLQSDLDLGLANIQPFPANTAGIAITPPGPANVITLPASQIVAVHPVDSTPAFPPVYRENSLNAVAEAFSILQANGHYENYALVLHTFPYADLHQALPSTLIEPVEPVSHLIKGGIFGTGTLPPFSPVTAAGAQNPSTGLPTLIQTNGPGQPFSTAALSAAPLSITGNVLYTGVLVSLSGNTMDHVRGMLDDSLDAMVTFNQKDQNEQYRFRVFQRFALRLKDPSAVILLLYMDS